MRVLVTGGRDYADVAAVFDELDRIRNGNLAFVVINGGASGADKLARDWCLKRCVEFMTVPADWKRWGRSAGPRRNQRMLEAIGKPDLVVAFPGGDGTQDMINRALRAGVRVHIYEPHRESRA